MGSILNPYDLVSVSDFDKVRAQDEIGVGVVEERSGAVVIAFDGTSQDGDVLSAIVVLPVIGSDRRLDHGEAGGDGREGDISKSGF